MKLSIPPISKGDLQNPERVEQLAHELHRLEFFRTWLEANAFMSSMCKHRGYALRNAPSTANALDSEFIGILENSWNRVHSAYDSVTGRLRPAFATDAATHNLPFQLYDAAFRRVQSGEAKTYDEALAAVCAETHTPVPQRLQAFEQLSRAEPELLAAEERAATALADARARLIAARSVAVGIVNTRDVLTDKIARVRTELAELQTKRDLITKRRERSAAYVLRTLRPGATLMLHTIADLGASVFGFDVALDELARRIPEKEKELTTAEKALTDFLSENAAALAPAN